MVARNYTKASLRLPQTSLPNLARLNDGVERRPKPKIQHPPEYNKNLINKFDNTTVIAFLIHDEERRTTLLKEGSRVKPQLNFTEVLNH
jgi:hypothetical protein